MKAKVKSAELGKALKLCVSAIEPKDQIRSNIEFEADVDNSLLLLKATNNQYSISVVCSAEVSDDGVAVVDGKMAYNVVAKATGDCTLSSNGEVLAIKGSGTTKLTEIDNCLPMLSKTKGKTVKCDSVAFKNAINKIGYAISEDQSRIVLTGAHIVTKDNEMTITSLDGFRLAQTYIMCSGDDIDVIVASRTLNAICDAINGDELTLSVDGVHLSIQSSDFSIDSVLLSGDYIDTERIIPKEFTTNVLVNTSEFRRICDSATVASGSSNLVKIHIEDDKIVVRANSIENGADFDGETSALVDGSPLDIAFNLKYLIQSINHVETEQCEIHCTTSVSPAIFASHNDEKADIHLILPVRVFA